MTTPKPRGRLARLVPDELTSSQQAVYDSIAGGDRAKGVQHFPLTAEDGSLNGPFGIMLHSPEVGGVLSQLGAAIRFKTDLTARIREVAILQVAHSENSTFEWWAHERVGRAVGLTAEELTALGLGSFTSADPVEQAAADFCGHLLTSSVLTDDEYGALRQTLSEQQLLDLTVLVGYYRTLAQMMAVFDVGVPTDLA